MRRLWLVILALLVVAAAILALWLATRPPAVTVVAARQGDLVAALSATGVVETPTAQVAPTVVGRISALYVREGERVKAGQLLARLAVPELQAAVRQVQAELQAARAEAASLRSSLRQQQATSRASIEQAQAQVRASLSRLQELQAGSRPQQVRQAEEALASARADLDLAQAQFERAQALLAQGAISQADLDQARARLATANAQAARAEQELSLVRQGPRREEIAAARAQVQAAEAQARAIRAAAGEAQVLADRLRAAQARVQQAEAALAQAESRQAEAEVRSPITGRVGRRYLDVGDLAGPTAPILLAADNDRLWVVAEVDEEDVELLHPGQRVAVSAEALPRPLSGTVIEVGAAAVPRGPELVRARIVRSRIRLDQASALLRSGMDVDISSRAVLARNVILVPVAAVNVRRGRAYVWVVRQGRAEQREVEAGRRTYETMAITSGLRAGDLVVVTGQAGLRSGGRVAIRQEQANE